MMWRMQGMVEMKSSEEGSQLKQPVYNLDVSLLVAGLISCNGRTDLPQLLVAKLRRMRSCVAMAHLGHANAHSDCAGTSHHAACHIPQLGWCCAYTLRA